MISRHPRRLAAGVLLVTASWFAAGTSSALADDAVTPTSTPTIEILATSEPTETPSPPTVAVPTATHVVRVRPTATPVTTVQREGKRRRKHGKPSSGAHVPSIPPTPTPTPTAAKAHGHHRKHHRRTMKATPTPSPTPTRTPALNLNTEDSVSPVTCNGPAKPPASRPFLDPPYHGWTSIVSYFDHDLPDFVQDGSVVAATGLHAGVDPTHHRTDFPAYWNSDIRQYVYYDGHNGYDFNVSYVPIYAAASGKVIFSAFEYPDAPTHGYGQMIMLDHRNGYVSLYGHLSKILVKNGQRVHRGQKIAVSGNTGHSTGPHLHFTVFHNCTPTDPYGWSGGGEDPLVSYQGEMSTYLWMRQPLVANPPPAWPGMKSLSIPPTARIVLLNLPPERGGTAGFTAALKKEAEAVLAAMHLPSGETSIDLFQGAIRVVGPIDAEQIYALPGVASITSPDTIEGAKADMLAALARAALTAPHHSWLLNRTHKVTGTLIRWGGRTLLVGKAARGGHLSLRLSHGHGGTGLSHINVDPATGIYAVDLGSLTSREYKRLQQLLQHRGQTDYPVRVQPAPSGKRTGRATRAGTRGGGMPVGLGVALLLVIATALCAALRKLNVLPGISRE